MHPVHRSLLLLAVAALVHAGTASATIHLVENPNDSGAGSLRDAILQANANTAATPADPDTILLSPDIGEEAVPVTAWPVLANHITMIGTDSLSVQIKGAKTFRVLAVAAGWTVRLINVRVTSGSVDNGAGILNAGDLTMINCNVRNCTTAKLGGAIENTGRLTLINCWLDKDKVNKGGGLNTGGGGLSNDEPGTATLINCTLSNDICSKGGYGGAIRSASAGGVFLTNCTIVTGDSREPTPGGGGIATIGTGVTTMDNTIVIGSITGGDLLGPVNSTLGHNLIGVTAGGTLLGDTDGNITGVLMSSVVEPTLEHNGVAGRTHALLPGSPAQDNGSDAVTSSPLSLAVDARGLPRVASAHVDIGAFEEQQPLGPNAVTNTSFEGTLGGWEPYSNATVSLGASGLQGGSSVHVAATAPTPEAFGLNDTPYWLKSTVAGGRYRFSAMVRSNASHGSAWLQLREYTHSDTRLQLVKSPKITLTPDWQLVQVDLVAVGGGSKVDFQVVDTPVSAGEDFDVDLVSIHPVLGPDTPPRVFAPLTAVAYVGLPLVIDMQAYDPDGDSLTLSAVDASAIATPGTFTATPDWTSGRFVLVPQITDTSSTPYTLIFSAENLRTGHVLTSVKVLPAPLNLVGNPGFETDLTGWARYGNGVLSSSPDAHSGAAAMLITGSATSVSSFGCTDQPDWVAAVPSAGTRYHVVGWVKAATGGGIARLRLREYQGTSQVGSKNSADLVLGPGWQFVTLDYVAHTAGNSLDLRITEDPTAPGASFLVDDVTLFADAAATAAVAMLPGTGEGDGPGQTALLSGAGGGGVPGHAAAAALRVLPDESVASEPGCRTFAIEGLGREFEDGMPAASLLLGTRTIAARADLTRMGVDHDGNGLEELAVSFPGDALRGADGLAATIVVAPGTAHEVRVPVSFARTPAATVTFAAWVPQQPIRGRGTLVFSTTRPEPVHVALFDASGRLVRTLDDERAAPAGRHTLAIGGAGGALESGIYFYRIATTEGVLAGHFALMR